jgi:hypothetical protein
MNRAPPADPTATMKPPPSAHLKITLLIAGLVFAVVTSPDVARALRAAAPAGDDGIVTGAVTWTVHGDSLTAKRSWALERLPEVRRPAVADATVLRHPRYEAPDRRGRRPWYSYSAATYRVRSSLLGARFEGIVLSYYNGRPYRCSGTVVDSPNGSVVWTAGHCIFNREFDPRPFTNIVFVPAAVHGPSPDQPVAPYGVWPAIRWAVTRDWYVHGSVHRIKRDLGALLLARNARGQTISQALGGAQRISFRGTATGRAKVIGYPASGRFAGNDSPIGCGPRPIGQARFGGPGPNPAAIDCAMTLGASGGPWLEHVNARGIGTVISVTSAEADRHPQMFGPVLDRVGRRVWSSLAHRDAH